MPEWQNKYSSAVMISNKKYDRQDEPPNVSVCVPTYNYGRFLSLCIESVQRQTFTNWEMVVCDDQSTDDTESVAAGYATRDSRIRYIRNNKRLGMNANLKFAADQGRGKYLKILCADDWLTPECLEIMIELMEKHPNVALATCAGIFADEAGKPLFVEYLFPQALKVLSGSQMLDRMAAGHGPGGNSSFMIRTNSYHAAGGYNGTIRYAGDYELAARLCRTGDYLHTRRPLYYYRRHSGSSSSIDPIQLLDVMDWLEIPNKIFGPRRFLGREWRRYHRLISLFTARYMTFMVVERIRGRRQYSRHLWSILRQLGDLPAGLAYLPFHLAYRCYALWTGANMPRRLPVPSNLQTSFTTKSQAEVVGSA